MKPTAPLRYNFVVFATTPCRGLSFSRYMVKRCSILLLLAVALALPLRAGEPSDDQLTKLMVGAWRSPRHDYIYFSDGTWWMGKKEPGVLHGRWRIKNHRLETSSTYADEKGPEPGESSEPIKKLTRDEIIFGAGYKMTRIDLSEVDKPR